MHYNHCHRVTAHLQLNILLLLLLLLLFVKRGVGVQLLEDWELAKRVSGKQTRNGHVWKRTLLKEGGGGVGVY